MMSFEVHERLHNLLLDALIDPPCDPHFQGPSPERVKNADRWVWTKIATLCGSGLKPAAGATRTPADEAMIQILEGPLCHKLSTILSETPRGSEGRGTSSGAASSSMAPPPGEWSAPARQNNKKRPRAQTAQHDDKGEVAELKRRLAAAEAKLSNTGSGRNNGKGGGKSKGKSGNQKGSTAFPPPSLQPGVGRTAEGHPICFAFNLGGCDGAPAGGTCPKGKHVCTKIGCQHPHPAHMCTKK